jgi:hypothetical protein
MLTGTGVIALVGENTYAHTPKMMAYLEGAASPNLPLGQGSDRLLDELILAFGGGALSAGDGKVIPPNEDHCDGKMSDGPKVIFSIVFCPFDLTVLGSR